MINSKAAEFGDQSSGYMTSSSNHVIDLAAHRAEADERFPQVDDIIDRLTLDAANVAQTGRR